MTALLIRPPWPAQTAWVGAWASDPSSDTPAATLMNGATLEALPPGKSVVLVVPAALLSWHRLTLPKLPTARWRTALENLLEDRLLSEPALVHLALAPDFQPGQEGWVAACDKTWLSEALHALEQAGRDVVRIVPEFEPGPPRVHLQGQPERGWLVDCSPQGVQCLPLSHPVQDSLKAWRALSPTAAASLTAEPVFAPLVQEVWGEPAQLVPAAQALQQAAASSWNLAQLGLESRRSGRQGLARVWRQFRETPAWRPARWGVATLLAVQLMGLQAWAWNERRQLEARQDELRSLLTRTFPQVKVVIEPLQQMARETTQLTQAHGQAGPGDLTRMLAALSASSAPAPRALEFRSGELTLSSWTPPPGLQNALLRQGYRLEPQADRWVLRPAPEEVAP